MKHLSKSTIRIVISLMLSITMLLSINVTAFAEEAEEGRNAERAGNSDGARREEIRKYQRGRLVGVVV